MANATKKTGAARPWTKNGKAKAEAAASKPGLRIITGREAQAEDVAQAKAARAEVGPRLSMAPTGPMQNPAKAGAEAAKADDAARDAHRMFGTPIPAALTGQQPAKAAPAPKAAVKAAKPAKAAAKPAAKAERAAPSSDRAAGWEDGWAAFLAKPHEGEVGARAQVLVDARAGKLPPAPDFTAETHAPYRKRLEVLVAMVKAADLAGLAKADMIPPRSASPQALRRYRDLAVIALKAKAAKAKAQAARIAPARRVARR